MRLKYTDNLKLKMPGQTEFYNVDDFNENAEIIDKAVVGKATVSISDTEPEKGPVLWFNTSGQKPAISTEELVLDLTDVTEQAVMNANVEGEEYSVANVNEAKKENDSTYSFEIL